MLLFQIPSYVIRHKQVQVHPGPHSFQSSDKSIHKPVCWTVENLVSKLQDWIQLQITSDPIWGCLFPFLKSALRLWSLACTMRATIRLNGSLISQLLHLLLLSALGWKFQEHGISRARSYSKSKSTNYCPSVTRPIFLLAYLESQAPVGS